MSQIIKEICDEGAENLTIGIIKQAVRDYAISVKWLRHHMSVDFLKKSQVWISPNYYNEYRDYLYLKGECEGFFKSSWLKALTKVDPEIIKQAAEEKSWKTSGREATW